MRTAIAIATAAILAAALAAPATAGTHTCSGKVITAGTAIGKLQQACGKPDRIVPLVNRFGAGVGERWEYYTETKTVLITLQGGKVVAVETVL